MEYDEDICITLFWFDPLGFFCDMTLFG
jgi:hypothetical protein